ncbi:response regulator transcription factor [Pseudonocardia sp. C8]|uniref:response regulator n=1 Tax=Pseudonocardia sp. C8 TaxID=2762759 RepID=UPI0016430C65|nr:response regulator transcription factor [Pseudonocardia sp. C8]MBC3190412.1 response regulator transcription factor [Pseudonocardia sp. C8]
MDHRPLRIVIVDDHEMVRFGLQAMLQRYADRIEVVGDAARREHALQLVEEHRPEIVLSDVRMRGFSGLDLCRELVARAAPPRVVLLSVYDDEQYLYQALNAGASGYLLKRIGGEELVRSLELVAEGETVVDPTLGGRAAGVAARAAVGRSWPGAQHGLTQRESEVLSLMVRGASNQSIAAELVLGQETIKSHVRAIYRKLKVSDRASAVGLALRDKMFA